MTGPFFLLVNDLTEFVKNTGEVMHHIPPRLLKKYGLASQAAVDAMGKKAHCLDMPFPNNYIKKCFS